MNKENEALELLGKEIVDNLKQQHQDFFPHYFERKYYNQWQFGSIGTYIVKKDNKRYEVTLTDDVLKAPLYINIITDIKII